MRGGAAEAFPQVARGRNRPLRRAASSTRRGALTRLEGARFDANEMRRVLKAKFGYDVQELVEEQATRDGTVFASTVAESASRRSPSP